MKTQLSIKQKNDFHRAFLCTSINTSHCTFFCVFMYTLLCTGLFLLCSCGLNNSSSPYAISSPQCTLVTPFSSYEIAGVNFDFVNTSNKTISGIEVSFLVFDSVTKKNPFITSNLVFAKINKTILPKQKSSFEISLDDKISVIPEQPYEIEFFTLKKIYYKDGSVFTNFFPQN